MSSLLKVTGAANIDRASTMSSIELVDLINSMREPGRAELRHDHFMAKIEKHPGIDSPKFLGQYKDSTRRTLKCYALPKRECELMVMSESLAVQAKVYDRMAELEGERPDPLASLPPEHRALIALMCENAALKTRQDDLAATQLAQQATLARVEANQVAAVASVQSFTALGYSIFRQTPMSAIELARLGRKASAISKKRGISVDQVSDCRFGRVGAYHISVLDDAFEQMTK
jgi:hypothetical protein